MEPGYIVTSVGGMFWSKIKVGLGFKRGQPKRHGGDPEMLTSNRRTPSNIAALRCGSCQVGFFDYRQS
jgi:hypothetical protein